MCSRKERTAKRCRTEQRREQCGTTEKCSVKDLGNGFAEEVCVDEPKYCQVDHEVCDPAVFADWCTWTELRWGPPEIVKAEGTDARAHDPSVRPPGPDEAVTWRRVHTVRLEPLAGAKREALDVSGEVFRARRVGELVYVGRSIVPVPARLVPPPGGQRIDCGEAVPQDRLATREWCRYTHWGWVAEEPLVVREDDATPDWPDALLGDDGREVRKEWIEVELAWARGDIHGGRRDTLDVDAWDEWPVGRVRPVVVDRDAVFVEWAAP